MTGNRERDDVVSLVRRIMSSSGAPEEVEPLIEELSRSVPHPAPSDLIFWPEREFTPEEIADIALGWSPGMPLKTDPEMA
jgi:hypothetical protein